MEMVDLGHKNKTYNHNLKRKESHTFPCAFGLVNDFLIKFVYPIGRPDCALLQSSATNCARTW
jgi:hypothetical protein